MAENQNRLICPFLSAAGIDLFVCEDRCVFYDKNERNCLLRKGLELLSRIINGQKRVKVEREGDVYIISIVNQQ